MSRAKSINVFLMDGESDGRIKCTMSNWTGVAYKIPRTELDKCRDRNELNQSGVYFLFGISDDFGKNVVYVGQAGARKNGEGILGRLFEHKRNPDKDYWTEAVAFTTQNDSLGPTEISYLENRFCNLAIGANRYDVKNGNDPTPGNVTEEKESELEEFVDYAKTIMGVLGHKVFIPIKDKTVTTDNNLDSNTDEPLLYGNFRNTDATGKQINDGFLVYKNSKLRIDTTKSCPANILRYREQYADKINDAGVLTEDLLFGSPSGAAEFVIGASYNGYDYWHDENGVTLKDLEAR